MKYQFNNMQYRDARIMLQIISLYSWNYVW